MNKKVSLIYRIIAINFLMLALVGAAFDPAAQAKDHKAFAALSARLSEQAGYFDSDNLISNETSYQHVLSKVRELNVNGGVYIGVGPDQNFTYIAKVRPRLALITDIRRDNLLQHLLFKSMFGRSRNRIEYLCLWFGKPFPKTKGWDTRGIKEIIEYLDATPADQKLYETTAKKIRGDVQKYGIALSQTDLETVARIQKAFYTAGLDIRYSSYHRPPRSIYPTYRDLLVETDLAGQQQNYFATEADFQYVKEMEDQDRIVPVVCDLSGPQALKSIGRYVADLGEQVSAFYVSNVEFYLHRQGTFDRFIENLRSLPVASNSIIIRSYFNYYAPPHPQAIANHFSTQLLQRIEDLLKMCAGGECGDYNDVVTKNSIPLQ